MREMGLESSLMRRFMLAWVVMAALLVSCGSDSGKSRPGTDGPAALPTYDDGSVGSSLDVDGPVSHPAADGAADTSVDLGAPDRMTCPAGASESDCQRCGPTLPSGCKQVCPSVDCSVYPVPAECAAVCSGSTCCACAHSWQLPQVPVQCGNACSDMVSRWQSYLADPAMVACATASDCVTVGGQPFMDPCNGYSTIGYCGVAANAAVYRASPAAGLETDFSLNCKDHIGFDCGPGFPECIAGKCVLQHWGCCMCHPDAGSAAIPDAPVSVEAGAVEAGAGEAGADEAGSGQ